MLLYMVTPQSLSRLRQQMEEAAAEAGRPAPKLAVWLTCAVDPKREAINQLLRAVVGYLAAPGYSEMISDAGFAELVAFARTRPHPKELLAAMPDQLISAIGLVGSEAAITERLEQYLAAGADEVCLVPATAGDPGGLRTLEIMSKRQCSIEDTTDRA
jgi:alkanesulfonate monooxygenase SsuD/methylene tetrahydromethanopterin reductase-like flavin-dependent oxidoreductase (luciferase family)